MPNLPILYRLVILLLVIRIISTIWNIHASHAQENISSEEARMLQQQIHQGYLQASEGARLMREIESRLVPIQARIETLKEQVTLLDYEYKETRKSIQESERQILVAGKEIDLLQKQVELYSGDTLHQQKVLLDLGLMLYVRQQEFADIDDDAVRINPIKLVLASSSIADVKNHQQYLLAASRMGHDLLRKYESNMEKLTLSRNMLEERTERLITLKQRLLLQKEILATQKEAKDMLLQFTRGSEASFQEILGQARKEQERVIDEVRGYQSQLRSIQELLDINSPQNAGTLSLLEWPVSPSQGLTAHYQDPAYKDRFGIEHNAIDIRAREGTEIISPAEGYVYKVHDAGLGYSYLIIAHRSNIMTVYGHLMEFYVKEGDIVSKGQILGLTGGRPGTRGAGLLTTGPHLHFEVFRDGKHIDPLTVLNLSSLPVSSLPQE